MVVGQTALHRAQTILSDVTEADSQRSSISNLDWRKVGWPHMSQAGARPPCLTQVQYK